MMDSSHSSSSEEGGGEVESLPSTVEESSIDVAIDIKETISVVTPDGTQIDPLTEPESEATTPTMASRAYQLEMLDQSLKRNVIVAMDTGSGKTQVAVLRIQAELEKSATNKLIWFLAPTVSLCEQQYEVIKLQNAATKIKLITGNDKAKTWSKPVWTIILENARLLVSTPAVLEEALSHAFVTIDHLSLLVFDEAHNCVGNDPGSKVMANFYFPRKQAKQPVPAILGLTASPIMKSKITSIEQLESTLDAVIVTPTLHREELLKAVNKPELSFSEFRLSGSLSYTPAMKSLRHVLNSMDITTDPYIRRLLADGTDRSRKAITEAIQKNKTPSQDQMKGLWQRSVSILQELGPWAANHYIYKVTTDFLRKCDSKDAFYDQWMDKDKVYLADILRQVSIPSFEMNGSSDISQKVAVLIQRLLFTEGDVVGIVFVKERATVAVIHDLLTSVPEIAKRYRIGKAVGASNYHLRKRNMYEMNDSADLETLQNFRSGKINLLVATSVLEEGIDVPACNLVICFDVPGNLKAFIQRRGRARMRKSSLVLLLDQSAKKSLDWEDLEQQMKRQYQEEERELREMELMEDSEETGTTYFLVPATGARLDFGNAKSHLEHFCRVLTKGEFVDCRPDYLVHCQNNSGERLLKATVLLPACLPKDLRQADSVSLWKSEKNAMKDAAFQAYVALYKARLVNDHLLPFKSQEIPGVVDHVPRTVQQSPYNPWPEIAQLWEIEGIRWLYTISCQDENGVNRGNYELILPVQLPQPRPVTIHMDHQVQWQLNIRTGKPIPFGEANGLPDHTPALLRMIFGHRWQVLDGRQVVQIFIKDENLTRDQIGSIAFDPEHHCREDQDCLIRAEGSAPYSYKGVLASKPPISEVQHPFYGYDEAPEDVPYLLLKKWSKRADLLHPPQGDPSTNIPSSKPYGWVYPMSWAAVDAMPKRHAKFAMFLPTIIHELEVMLMAKKLNTTLLHPLGISDLQLIIEAISSRSAVEPVDYERAEFLGDSILKFCTCIQAAAGHLTWPEGYLSLYKNRLVSNARLHRASTVNNLPQFILAKPFTGHKWRPLYLENLLGEEKPLPAQRLGAKMIADVVEALIGVSYQSGGLPQALKCISLFIDEVDWHDPTMCQDILFAQAPNNQTLPPDVEPLEEMIGYTFNKKSLLIEAITHASFVASPTNMDQRSLERLEFIGDAVLDMIIVNKMFNVVPPLPHYKMHMLKTAVVNADFLAFISLEYRTYRTELAVNEECEVVEEKAALPLWRFLRHDSPGIGLEVGAAETRFQNLRGEIRHALDHGSHYPWALLARLRAKKFYSDLVEAIIGAIWIDSGSLQVCEEFLTRLGVLQLLDRFVRDNVQVQHPKEEIGKLAMVNKVTYTYKLIEGPGGEKEYRCTLHVGERLLADVGGGVSQEEIKTKAAEEAVRFLTVENMAMDLD